MTSQFFMLADDLPTSSLFTSSLSNRCYNPPWPLYQARHTYQPNRRTGNCENTHKATSAQQRSITASNAVYRNDPMYISCVASTLPQMKMMKSALYHQPIRMYSSDSGNNDPPKDHPILSEDPDQNAHSRSLIRVYTVR